MKAQDLKNSILQLAIQGKLVEQREEEGTARELIEQIQAEKEKLIKEKKIKKEKPLPEITEDEIPFDIPESWEWVKLGEIIKITTGNKDANHGVENGKYDFFTCSKEAIKSNTYSYDGECILLPGNGANVGLSIYYQGKFEAYQRTYVLEKLISEFNMKYLQVALEWNWKRYNSNKLFGSAIPYIKMGNLENYSFPLPPLEEQKRIVAKIEEIMPYVEQYDKAYTEVEELNKKFPEDMQKSILQYAIQGKLVEQREEDGTAEELYQIIQAEKEKLIKEGKIKKSKPLPEITEDEIPFDIPESWKWVYINDVAFVTKLAGFEYTKYMSNAILSVGEIPLVRAKNIKPNNFMENEEEFITRELSEKLSRCALDARCILMTFIGAGIGEVAIFDNKRRNHLAPNVAKIVPHIDINIYLLYYFMSYTGQREIFKYMKRTAQPSLSMETIRKVIIPLPPLEEQKRIVKKIEELLPHTKQLGKKIKN